MLLPLLGFGQTNTDGVITLGRNALYYEDYALSIQYFNQAIQAKPYLYEPFFYRAVAKYYLGDYQGALEDCSSSIERDPFIDDCYKLRAITYIMVGKYSEAIRDYRQLLSMQVENRDFWSNMVLCETQLDSLDEANSLLDSMIVKWPNYARCYIIKAQIAVQQKDTVSADTLLNQALRVSPFEVDAWSAKGLLYLQRSDFKNAENAYDKAILQTPKEAGFYLNRALARYRQHNLRGAMDDYDISLDIEPDNYLGHYNRGLLRMQVGENNLAIKDFDFVLKKEPNDRLALFNRATLSELTGNYRAAIRDYTTVLKQYPDFTTGYEKRALCYRRIGDTHHAIQDERKVVIAQLDDAFGSHKRKRNKYTRKQKEQNIDDYQKLVVDNNEDNLAKFYSSDYRGRVQNRDVAVELQPSFVMTYNSAANGLSGQINYATFVEKINQNHFLPHKLSLATRETPSEASELKEEQSERAHFANNLKKNPQDEHFRFAYSLYLTFQRDFSESLSQLDSLLRKSPDNLGALFLRSSVRIRVADMKQLEKSEKKQTLQGTETDASKLLLQAAQTDLQQAIGIDSTCAFLYYNLGYVNAKMKDYPAAIQNFTKAISLKTDLAEAYYNRGLVQIDLQNFQAGFDDLSKSGELGLYSAYSLIKHFRKVQQDLAKQKK